MSTEMARRNHGPKEFVSKLRQADVLIAQGLKIPAVVLLALKRRIRQALNRPVSAAKSGLIRRLPMSGACDRRACVSSNRPLTSGEPADVQIRRRYVVDG